MWRARWEEEDEEEEEAENWRCGCGARGDTACGRERWGWKEALGAVERSEVAAGCVGEARLELTACIGSVSQLGGLGACGYLAKGRQMARAWGAALREFEAPLRPSSSLPPVVWVFVRKERNVGYGGERSQWRERCGERGRERETAARIRTSDGSEEERKMSLRAHDGDRQAGRQTDRHRQTSR